MRLITPKQLADLVGVAVSTLKKWRSIGCGPPWVRIGRRIFYDLAEVEKWIDQNRFCSTAEYV